MGLGQALQIGNNINTPSIKHDKKYGMFYDYTNVYSDLIKEIEALDYDNNCDSLKIENDSYNVHKHHLENKFNTNLANTSLPINKYYNLRYSTIYKMKILYQMIEFKKIHIGYSINFLPLLMD